jgi:hypothetical protein
MRYLKLFERIYGDEESRVKNFCEEYLIYLIDEGFYLTFHTITYDRIEVILKKKDYSNNRVTFNWDDVKSDLIPLIEVLNSQTKNDSLKFKLTNHKIFSRIGCMRNHVSITNYENGKGAFGMIYNINNILNEDIQNRHKLNIKEIGFTVKKLLT